MWVVYQYGSSHISGGARRSYRKWRHRRSRDRKWRHRRSHDRKWRHRRSPWPEVIACACATGSRAFFLLFFLTETPVLHVIPHWNTMSACDNTLKRQFCMWYHTETTVLHVITPLIRKSARDITLKQKQCRWQHFITTLQLITHLNGCYLVITH